MVEELSICAFFDVLGTRAIFMGEDAERRRAVIDLVRTLARRATTYSANAQNLGGAVVMSPSAQTTTFSDNVVVSFPLKSMHIPGHVGEAPHTFVLEAGRFFEHLLAQIVIAVWDGLQIGVLFRGGVAAGPIVHDCEIVAGRALVEAVELEKATEYPRIEIGAEVASWQADGLPLIREGIRAECLVEREGRWFVRALGFHAGYWGDHNYHRRRSGLPEESLVAVLERIRERLATELHQVAAAGNPRVRQKWEWFIEELEREFSTGLWREIDGAYGAIAGLRAELGSR